MDAEHVATRRKVREIAGHIQSIDNRLSGFERSTQLQFASVRDEHGNNLDVIEGIASGIDALPKAADALAKAVDARATADGKVTVYYQSDPPSTPELGDFWVDTGHDGDVSTYDGTEWNPVDSAKVKGALDAAQGAQTTADHKIVTYWQSGQPTGASVGDLWFDSDDKNKPHWWDGTRWQATRDGTIADAQTSANSAQSTADSARSTANAAMSTADGKGKVYWQSSAPGSGTSNDVWFDTSAGNRPYYWTGSSWSPRPLDHQALSIGTLSAISADLGTVTAGQISGVTISGVTITGATIRTRASGSRVEIDSEEADRIEFITSGGTGFIQALGSGILSPSMLLESPGGGTAIWLLNENLRIQTGDRSINTAATSTGKFWVGDSGGIALGNSTSDIYVGEPTSPYTYGVVNCKSVQKTSDRKLKQNIAKPKGSALAQIAAAPAKRYRFRADVRRDKHAPYHLGPMAEDLPDECRRVTEDGDEMADLGSMIGLLWCAVAELDARSKSEPKGART